MAIDARANAFNDWKWVEQGSNPRAFGRHRRPVDVDRMVSMVVRAKGLSVRLRSV